MNRGKIFASLLIIVVALALSFGATMAFFTDDIQAPTNTFQAGTVEIENGQEIVTPADKGNVNPGDCFEKCFTIINTGSKAIELRMTGFTGVWSFGDGSDVSGLTLLYEDGPLYIAPVGDDWKMRKVGDGFEFYYTGVPIASGEEVQLCIIVAFDGPKMDDDYQGITLELNGTFAAVQASNDAPISVWSDANWEAWNADGGWFSMNHYDALAYSMGAPYANYYETTKCFNGNGGNGGDPEPKLTIIKELLDANGETVGSSDVDFTATVTGGAGAFATGQDFTFSVDSPRVLGPVDGLEFDVEYTVTEQEDSDYLFVSIDPDTPFTLTAANNEVTVTVINQEKETNGSGGNETAYAGVNYFGPGQGGGWWRYFGVTDSAPINIYAGNSNISGETQRGTVIGNVLVSDPDGNNEVTITITLTGGWVLQSGVTDSVKIQGHASAPSSFQAPGNFETYAGNGLIVTVDSYDFYVIHLDVTGP